MTQTNLTVAMEHAFRRRSFVIGIRTVPVVKMKFPNITVLKRVKFVVLINTAVSTFARIHWRVPIVGASPVTV
jgi:hypothetical protein